MRYDEENVRQQRRSARQWWIEEIRQTLRQTSILLNQAANMLLKHSEILAEHDAHMRELDERMDRMQRHLEILSNISDGLIRDKPDGKKR